MTHSENVFIAPFPILDSLTGANQNDEEFKPDKLLFMGHQMHYPNVDAMKWFIEDIYESTYKQNGLKLYVTGYWDKEFKRRYKNVIFTGFVEDLSALMKNSLVISPIRLGGGGIRAKVIHAMAMGCPVIATKLCCEGMEDLIGGINILFAENEEEYLASIKRLINEKELCDRIISNARSLIAEKYSEKAAGKIRKNIYYEIIK